MKRIFGVVLVVALVAAINGAFAGEKAPARGVIVAAPPVPIDLLALLADEDEDEDAVLEIAPEVSEDADVDIELEAPKTPAEPKVTPKLEPEVEPEPAAVTPKPFAPPKLPTPVLKPPVPKPPVARPSPRYRSNMFGVRFGAMVLGESAEEFAAYDPGTGFGLFVQHRGLGKKIVWEAGFDYGTTEAETGETSTLSTVRAAALLGTWASESKTKFYGLVGVGGVFETNDEESAQSGLLDVGAGVMLGGKLDLRIAYEMYLGSENVSGTTAMSVGYGF